MLARKFSRSFDLKLAVNPTVVIRSTGKDLTQQEAKQMVGRSSRDQGKGSAVLFVIGS